MLKGIAKIADGGKGRQTSSRSTFRKAFPLAYENFGGHEAFSRSAADNSTEFYRICCPLISTEIKSSDGEGLTGIVNRSGTVIDHPDGAEPHDITERNPNSLGDEIFPLISKRTKYRTQKSKVCLVGITIASRLGVQKRE